MSSFPVLLVNDGFSFVVEFELPQSSWDDLHATLSIKMTQPESIIVPCEQTNH